MRIRLWFWQIASWIGLSPKRRGRLFRYITVSAKPPVQLLSVDQFRDPGVAKALARTLADMSLSRRGAAKFIEDRITLYEPGFLFPSGLRVHEKDFPAFSDMRGDDTGKWFGDFLTWPNRNFRQAIQGKITHRLQWIDAALRAH